MCCVQGHEGVELTAGEHVENMHSTGLNNHTAHVSECCCTLIQKRSTCVNPSIDIMRSEHFSAWQFD